MSIIGNKHSFKDYGLQIGPLQFASLMAIDEDPKQSLEYAYGTGNEPQDLVTGNREYTGTVTIEKQELIFLLNGYGANSIIDLPPISMVQKSENGLGQLETITWQNVLFEGEGRSINQNDKESPVKIAFKALGRKRGN